MTTFEVSFTSPSVASWELQKPYSGHILWPYSGRIMAIAIPQFPLNPFVGASRLRGLTSAKGADKK